MKTALIVMTAVELVVLVAVLAVYLVAIAGVLRRISATLGLVTFGVRAIEKQTQPIGPVLSDINAALEQVAGALEQVAGPKPPLQRSEEAIEPIINPEVSAESGAQDLGSH